LAAPRNEEDTPLSGEIAEDTQMNGTPNKDVPLESITPSESPTVVQQASCSQGNRDDCKQPLLGK
jgi:hypothetical protein